MEKVTKIAEILKKLAEENLKELISIHNMACDDMMEFARKIYPMDELDYLLQSFDWNPLFEGLTVKDIVRAVVDSEHCDLTDTYFVMNEDGHLVTFSKVTETFCPIYIPGLAEYMYDEECDYGNKEIEAVLSD